MAIIRREELPKIREQHRAERIVFCSGVFDLIHPGHVLFLEDCKRQGDVLVVGVGGDALARKRKGEGRPVLHEQARLKLVSALQPVDYCILEEVSADQHPLTMVEYALRELRPDVYVVNTDAHDIPYREQLAQECNARLVVLDRWAPPELAGISTTALIEKIRRLPNDGQ